MNIIETIKNIITVALALFVTLLTTAITLVMFFFKGSNGLVTGRRQLLKFYWDLMKNQVVFLAVLFKHLQKHPSAKGKAKFTAASESMLAEMFNA